MFFKSKPAPSFLSRLQGTTLVLDALREVETFELEERKKLIAEHEELKARLSAHLVQRAREEAEINVEILKLEARRTVLGERLIELDASGSRIRSASNCNSINSPGRSKPAQIRASTTSSCGFNGSALKPLRIHGRAALTPSSSWSK